MRSFILCFVVCFAAFTSIGQPYVTLYGARQIGAGCYQLNPDSVNSFGLIWSTTKIDLTQPFDKTFTVNLGNKDYPGADGISFTLQNSPAGLSAYGYTGSFMAYDNISPSLNFEIDTWDNSSNGYPDIAADHVAINKNGSVMNVVSGAVPASASSRNIEDNKCHKFRIRWVPSTQNINVFFDDTLRINKTYNIIDSVFGGVTSVYWGLTGACGSYSNQQAFCEVFADAGIDTAICPGDSVQLSASLAQAYLWFPSTGLSCTTCKSPKASPGTTTNYVLRATSYFGCIAYDTVKVTVRSGPTTYAGPDITLCQGDSVQLNVTGAGSVTFNTKQYLTDSTIANPWCKPPVSVSYIIKGTNASGCVKYDTLNVIVTTAPHANAGSDTFICVGGNVRLQASGGANYSWSPGTGLSATNVSNPLAFPSVTTTYKVVVSNGSCKDSDTVVVAVKPAPLTYAGNDKIICQGDSVQLNVTGADYYRWNNKLYLNDTTIGNPWARPLFTHTFIVTGYSVFGCSRNDTITVNVVPKVKVTAGADTGFCRGGNVQLKATPTGTSVVSWYPNYKISSTTSTQPVVNPDVDTTYYVVVNNGICSDTARVRVSVWEYPVAYAGTDATICNGDSVQLNATGTGTVQWIPAAGLSNSAILTPYAKPSVTTDYILKLSSLHGCESFDTVRVNVIERFTVNAGVDDTICPHDSVILRAATSAPQVEWSTGDTTFSITVSPLATTTYFVRALNKGCYGMPDSVTVVVDSTLHAIFIPTPDNGHVPLTVDFNNLSRGNITQHWDFGDGTSSSDPHPQHLYKAAGNYVAKLTVTNARGCIDTMSFLIVVTNNFKIVIPNVFTPNADNSNDLYEVYATGIQQFSLHIFNRWGQELFVSDDPQKQWDGKSMGQEMPEGEYYYTLTVKDYLEEVHAYKGILTIIR